MEFCNLLWRRTFSPPHVFLRFVKVGSIFLTVHFVRATVPARLPRDLHAMLPHAFTDRSATKCFFLFYTAHFEARVYAFVTNFLHFVHFSSPRPGIVRVATHSFRTRHGVCATIPVLHVASRPSRDQRSTDLLPKCFFFFLAIAFFNSKSILRASSATSLAAFHCAWLTDCSVQ